MLTYHNNKGLLRFHILDREPGVTHFVTTRHLPDGSGSGFNIGFSGGPEADSRANRALLSAVTNIAPKDFVFMNQVHGDSHFEVSASTENMGFASKESAVQGTDILITNVRGKCLVARSADCIPVLLYSPDSHSAAAIHSGREGTFLGAAAKAARLLHDNYGADYASMIACIGPGINGDCYEVGMDCAVKFLSDSRFASDTMRISGEKVFLDLKKMIFYDLLTVGLVATNIEISDICTKCCASDFFSARRGESQRFCAGICLN